MSTQVVDRANIIFIFYGNSKTHRFQLLTFIGSIVSLLFLNSSKSYGCQRMYLTRSMESSFFLHSSESHSRKTPTVDGKHSIFIFLGSFESYGFQRRQLTRSIASSYFFGSSESHGRSMWVGSISVVLSQKIKQQKTKIFTKILNFAKSSYIIFCVKISHYFNYTYCLQEQSTHFGLEVSAQFLLENHTRKISNINIDF